MTARMPNPFDFGLPLPTPAAAVPSVSADQTTAPIGDAPGAVVAPDNEHRFVPDMNRLYLDIVSMEQPEPTWTPLFLRKPPWEPTRQQHRSARAYIEALIERSRL